jgi:5-methylcytosine-specific restriction protein A
MGINYVPGQIVTRGELNASYGGGIQGGILTPAGGRYAFAFTDAESGNRYGYTLDGWDDSSHQTFFYTGEGSEGDQDFRRGGKNKTLLDSLSSDREIHVFEAVGRVPGSGAKKHCYLGQFRLNTEEPYRREDAPDRNGDNRSVIVFRFDAAGPDATIPATGDESDLADAPASSTANNMVSPESGENHEYEIGPRGSTWAVRIENKLECSWQTYLESQGHRIGRQRIKVAGQSNTLTTDTWDDTTRHLYEAKGSVTRESVRMAVGQLLDYRRHISPAPEGCSVLLPERPSDDLISFVLGLGLGIVYAEGPDFVQLPAA